MTNPLHTAIFDSKLADFFAEYARRNGPGAEPGVAVTLSSPGLDFHFELSVPGIFVPPVANAGSPGGEG